MTGTPYAQTTARGAWGGGHRFRRGEVEVMVEDSERGLGGFGRNRGVESTFQL